MSDHAAILKRNLDAVATRIAAACQRANRRQAEVRLLTVTKTRPPGILRDLISLGVRAFGENRIQEAEPKIAELPETVEWHLIGHLQSNKVRRAIALFPWIHSLDSAELVERADRIAAELGRRPNVLLELNVSGEASKHGAHAPEDQEALFQAATRAKHLSVVGLMTMAPLTADPEQVRPCFRRLRELRDALAPRFGEGFRELSMGMSGDYEIAIEEGATWVRVGSALFEGITETMANAAPSAPAAGEPGKDG